MSIPRNIYSKIIEISNKYLSGHPPIYVNSIAEELNVSMDAIKDQISELEALKLIEFMDPEKRVFALRNTGNATPQNKPENYRS